MKLQRVLILIAAAVAGTMVYKYQRARLDAGDSPRERSTYSMLTGSGSLSQSMNSPSSTNMGAPSGLGGGSNSNIMQQRSGSGIGGVGNPYGGPGRPGSAGNPLTRGGHKSSGGSALPKDDIDLIKAASEGNIDIFSERLTKGAKVDSRDSLKRTALMFASINNHVSICDRLLAAGADITLQDSNGNTAFDYAAGRGLTEMLEFLFQRTRTKDTNHHMEYARLIQAVMTGNPAYIPQGTGKLASVNRINPEGQSPLHMAVGSGLMEVAEELVKRGAQVNLANQDKRTPLHWAAWSNQTAMMEWLIAKGANPSLTDTAGNTPLMMAVMNNSADAARLLIAKGADKFAVNAEGKTAAIIAEDKGNKALAAELR